MSFGHHKSRLYPAYIIRFSHLSPLPSSSHHCGYCSILQHYHTANIWGSSSFWFITCSLTSLTTITLLLLLSLSTIVQYLIPIAKNTIRRHSVHCKVQPDHSGRSNSQEIYTMPTHARCEGKMEGSVFDGWGFM